MLRQPKNLFCRSGGWGEPGAVRLWCSLEWKELRSTLVENERQLRRELAELPPLVINVDIVGARAAWPDMAIDEKREFLRLFVGKVTVHQPARVTLGCSTGASGDRMAVRVMSACSVIACATGAPPWNG